MHINAYLAYRCLGMHRDALLCFGMLLKHRGAYVNICISMLGGA